MIFTVKKAVGLAAGAAALLTLAAWGSGAQTADSALSVSVLSSRPDMVSGGDALIEVRAPAGVSSVKLMAGPRDVSSALTAGPGPGEFRGLVSGLNLGKNELVATAGGKTAKLTITDYPITGPIFSGPHMTPYECKTRESGLGDPIDRDCSAPTKIDYFYRAGDNTFKPWPATGRPADLKNTTTIDGKTVPYIVKVESGVINRTIYRLAILDDPATPAKADGWNGRLGVSFGGGAGAAYNQGTNAVTAANDDLFLSRGFAHLVATELVNGLHGNVVLQAESLMMLKEHFIKEYGPPKWTVGSGGSGGAIQQLLIAEDYPGLLDGLQPSLSFPDSALHVPDCGLLQKYFRENPNGWSNEKQEAVIGFAVTPVASTCQSWNTSFVPVSQSNNKRGCQLTDASLVYDKEKNPKGARCALQDMRVNILGRNAQGYAPSELDNVGLQYGLKGLNDGKISVDQFLDLNEKIGGFDKDGDYTPNREVADLQALRALYHSGIVNSGGGGLATVPIIHSRTYNDARGDIHSRERDLVIRARLDRANGRHDNQVIWVYSAAPAPAPARAGAPGRAGAPAAPAAPAAVAPNPSGAAQSLTAMTAWLDAITADPAPLTTDKVVRHKPAAAVDGYWDLQGVRHDEVASWDNSKPGFNTVYPVHLEPRLVAGGPVTNDVFKCQLKPVKLTDYKVSFSADQQARLKGIFPQGVCDFSKPGVGQVKFGGVWQRY